MGNYDFRAIEPKWQAYWKEQRTFYADRLSDKPKYYVLDMFAYPSGAGLHVGHPLGYIATDILARYKWLRGFNVMHPMGFDAFGLPAEQYAIDTGQHPAETTAQNIERFKRQLTVLGLAYDPDTTDMKTCDPDYYRWTQWIFLKVYHSWYNLDVGKAEPVSVLREQFATGGSAAVNAFHTYEETFTADEWNGWTEQQQEDVLIHYRLTYPGYTMVNWCEAMGTVLANDEVINGRSERGGHPVERKPMRQWMFRMTAYADRLLAGLDTIDWPNPIKEQQRNWIGRSEGGSIRFEVMPFEIAPDTVTELISTLEAIQETPVIEVFSTRPDTIFGATFMVLAPEHELVDILVTPGQKEAVKAYVEWALNRSELERQAEVKTVTGVFTGTYAENPFSGKPMPIWIADYVLGGYGTGAIMAVPAHDSRDHLFAKHFGLEIVQVVAGDVDVQKEAFENKAGKLINSGFLNGLEVKDAIRKTIDDLEARGIGTSRVNYRLRDPNFSRQRYWGEPFPIYYQDDTPYAIDESELPVLLPEVESYSPTGTGESPLAAISDWVDYGDGRRRETNTMPSYAGSSWYWLRYLDPFNKERFVDEKVEQYWHQVDFYLGGSEHAVGHLLYSRFWNKVLFDLGYVSVDEPFQKLVNQGMITGRSSLIYRIVGENKFVSEDLKDQFETNPIHVPISYVKDDILDIKQLRGWKDEFQTAEFTPSEDGKFRCGYQIEKMSKRYYNTITPDEVSAQYGTDTFRLYEMFLGPIEDSKPFTLKGIEGVAKFVRRVWNLFCGDDNALIVTDGEPTKEELKVLHQTIKKVGHDIEKLSLNTCVSTFMIFVNEIVKLKSHKRAVLEPFLIVLAPFAPHITEELWSKLGHEGSITHAEWPAYNEEYLKEDSFAYPIQVNGKKKMEFEVSLALNKQETEAFVLAAPEIQDLLGGKTPRKVIVVPGRIINLVV